MATAKERMTIPPGFMLKKSASLGFDEPRSFPQGERQLRRNCVVSPHPLADEGYSLEALSP